MKITIFLLLIWSVIPLSGQSLSNQIIANGGQSIPLNQGYTISWTVGELFTATYQNKGTLTQGFHQGYNMMITSLKKTHNEITSLQIYPNPTFDRFFVETQKSTEPIRAKLYNLVGQPLQQFQVNGKMEINLANYPSGIYLLEIHNAWGYQATYKIQKQ